ncbi:molybdopterin molybdotransferase MoeA [Granulicella arctica]|uniref:Molybdopterin molybdenumtransferase n=1 Tax=Granulicella arctica TaxID=940613 RepID=A0A7Y9TGY6_9BACT|nr:gephyrin-like molybdotransferase Glp [Granulicella arctica]NYF79300.1 molybdopterin molybdotransferase [Granulicella arctica]
MDGTVLGFEEALALLLNHAGSVKAAEVEEIALLAAAGRVLAVDVVADRDQPPFDRSTRDGFAVRAEELNAGAALEVAGQIRAGEMWTGDVLAAGFTVEIMTGAPVPAGADAVVMVEHVERSAGAIRAGRTLKVGDNIVPRGSEARLGQVVLPEGSFVGAAEVALAAACGQESLRVYRRPRVAIVATGDELVELDQVPGPQQIRNSNSYALAALVAAAGGESVRLPIAPDQREAIRAAIEEGRRADLLVLSGGVSMGQYDLVEEVLGSLGAEFFFTGVRMQPGKPVVFGRLPATGEFPARFFFGLPGNPVSTQVTFHVFVEPMIRALCGAGAEGPRFVLATLAEDVAGKLGLTRLLPARLVGVEVKLVEWQGSGDLAANARANCYALLPAEREGFRAGEVIRVLLR